MYVVVTGSTVVTVDGLVVDAPGWHCCRRHSSANVWSPSQSRGSGGVVAGVTTGVYVAVSVLLAAVIILVRRRRRNALRYAVLGTGAAAATTASSDYGTGKMIGPAVTLCASVSRRRLGREVMVLFCVPYAASAQTADVAVATTSGGVVVFQSPWRTLTLRDAVRHQYASRFLMGTSWSKRAVSGPDCCCLCIHSRMHACVWTAVKVALSCCVRAVRACCGCDNSCGVRLFRVHLLHRWRGVDDLGAAERRELLVAEVLLCRQLRSSYVLLAVHCVRYCVMYKCVSARPVGCVVLCAVSLRFNEGKEANAAVAFLSFATIAIVASIGFGFITSHSQLHFAKRQMAVTLAGGAGTWAVRHGTMLQRDTCRLRRELSCLCESCDVCHVTCDVT